MITKISSNYFPFNHRSAIFLHCQATIECCDMMTHSQNCGRGKASLQQPKQQTVCRKWLCKYFSLATNNHTLATEEMLKAAFSVASSPRLYASMLIRVVLDIFFLYQFTQIKFLNCVGRFTISFGLNPGPLRYKTRLYCIAEQAYKRQKWEYYIKIGLLALHQVY